jgi:hypothetical protein
MSARRSIKAILLGTALAAGMAVAGPAAAAPAPITDTGPALSCLVPVFDVPVPTLDGFTVTASNAVNVWGYDYQSTPGVADFVDRIGPVAQYSVTGLAAGQSATMWAAFWTVVGCQPGPRAEVTGAALATALAPTLDAPVRTATGFTVNVTNYDANFTWTPTTSAGTAVNGTPDGSTLPVTVSGLTAGQSSKLTMTSTRTGYIDGTADVTGSALNAALAPTLDAPVRTATGFTVNVTNYDANFTWTPTATAGTAVNGTPDGSTLPVTVSGLTAGQSSKLTMTSTRMGYIEGTADVTGQAADPTPPAPPAPNVTPMPTPTPAVTPTPTQIATPQTGREQMVVAFFPGRFAARPAQKKSVDAMIAKMPTGSTTSSIIVMRVPERPNTYDLALARQRANGVHKYLTDRGIGSTYVVSMEKVGKKRLDTAVVTLVWSKP